MTRCYQMKCLFWILNWSLRTTSFLESDLICPCVLDLRALRVYFDERRRALVVKENRQLNCTLKVGMFKMNLGVDYITLFFMRMEANKLRMCHHIHFLQFSMPFVAEMYIMSYGSCYGRH